MIPTPDTSSSPLPARPTRAFTTVEILVVVLIMSIVAVICADSVSNFESAQRPDRAAREALGCFRYARSLAMSTGKSAKVTVSANAKTLSVYWMSNGSTWDATPVTTGTTASGTWVVSLASPELAGTTLALTPSTTTDFIYNAIGTCGQTGVVTFTYSSKSKTLTIARIGDPVLN